MRSAKTLNLWYHPMNESVLRRPSASEGWWHSTAGCPAPQLREPIFPATHIPTGAGLHSAVDRHRNAIDHEHSTVLEQFTQGSRQETEPGVQGVQTAIEACEVDPRGQVVRFAQDAQRLFVMVAKVHGRDHWVYLTRMSRPRNDENKVKTSKQH